MQHTILLCDLTETCGPESPPDRLHGWEAGPIDRQEGRKRLLEDAQVGPPQVRRGNYGFPSDPGYLPEGGRIIPQLVEDHDGDRRVKAVRGEGQAVGVSEHSFKGALPPRMGEHVEGRVERHDLRELREQAGETTRPRAHVEDSLPGGKPSKLAEGREPELAVYRLVRAPGVVVPCESPVIHAHERPKNGGPYESAEAIPMAIAEFSITPVGVGTSVGDHVARAVDLVDRSGLAYKVNAMGTVVEGPLAEVFALIARCHTEVAKDCERVSTIIKIDDRRGVQGQIDSKVADVERRLGRKLRT